MSLGARRSLSNYDRRPFILTNLLSENLCTQKTAIYTAA
ncbi:hypothetical protein ACPOL_6732 (plasmid) [Acidisarcina polymorpha]|uniref:Uncharacterized protein n=1 Tax=Acidisarcina polymorpha TaxID=2211140 RepID=A0A2Z5GB51_9BACT|nr:hypothetical protein ACPOL_6732 [Acidisarcina polymorpha]